MGAAQWGCMRMLGFIMFVAVALSVFAVSYENEFWNFWGRERNSRRGQPSLGPDGLQPAPNAAKGFAHAMPVGKAPSEVDDVEDGVMNETSEDIVDDASEGQQQADSVSPPADEIQIARKPDSENVSPARNPTDDFLTQTDEVQSASDTQTPDTTNSSIEAEEQEEEDLQSYEEEPQKTMVTNPETKEDEERGSDQKDMDGEIESANQYQSERRTRAKTFLVVFMGHSGSTAFTTELRTHTEFEVELLEPLEHGEYQGNTELALKRARELMDRGIAQGKIPGFKIRPFHINNMPEKWQAFVKEYDSRIIWQYRENIVKQAIGEYRHRFLNDSSVVEGLKKNEKPCAKGSDQKCRIKIENMRGLHGLMNDFSGSDELLASAARNLQRDEDMSIVRYEDYLYYRERTMREAFDFLGVDFQDTAPQRIKASPDSLCEMVSNFQEVCDHFLPCQLWRPYLHDSVNNCRCKPGSWKSFDSTYCRRSAWYQSKE